jgi:carboxymethylenebutenolidase
MAIASRSPCWVTGCGSSYERRRALRERAAKFAVGEISAAMLLDQLSPRFAKAQEVAKDDKRLRREWIDYDSPQGSGNVRA